MKYYRDLSPLKGRESLIEIIIKKEKGVTVSTRCPLTLRSMTLPGRPAAPGGRVGRRELQNPQGLGAVRGLPMDMRGDRVFGGVG